MSRKIVITSAVRTPVGAFLGGLKKVPVQNLCAQMLREAASRSNLGDKDIDDVVVGHVISSADTGNLARHAALLAGFDLDTPGYTVNRICGSGIQAVVSAAQELRDNEELNIVLAAGAESLSRVPYYLPLSARYDGLKNGTKQLLCSNDEYTKNAQPPKDYSDIDSMGITAENIVSKYSISREDQDRFAYDSQMKCKRAMESGRFAEEIVPVEVKSRKETVIVDRDEHPRPNTTLEALAKLKPAFKEGGSVTAGNSSGMNDAAACVVVMTEDKCKELGLTPMAYVEQYSLTALDPRIMGIGPVGAIGKLLKKTGLTLDDIGHLEINEAFAGQVLGCCKELGNYLDTPLYARLNPNGGACALGHPLGMTGVRLVTTICHEFKHNDAKYGIASACIGAGQGIALLLRRPE
jgi:acetyl-CoA C-acetyltransferase